MTDRRIDQHFLKQALTEAWIRRGFCAPNPAVGCVVVRDGRVISTGFHRAAGLAHAEVEALRPCIEEAKGATLYVTLEPCCIWGRTPPCTDLIIEKKIARVVYAEVDRDPRVHGRGAEILNRAGIICNLVACDEITAFYESFRHWHETKRPFVTAKLALSLDGKIAGPKNIPVRLTSPETDELTHRSRFHTDAILSTARTVLCDDPKLNARLGNEVTAKPLYLLDRTLSLTAASQVFQTAREVTIFHDAELTPQRESFGENVRFISTPTVENRLDWVQIMREVGRDGVHDLWVEAGGMAVRQLFESGHLNRLRLVVTPKWLGAEAHSAFLQRTDSLFSSARITWTACGQDAICEMNW